MKHEETSTMVMLIYKKCALPPSYPSVENDMVKLVFYKVSRVQCSIYLLKPHLVCMLEQL